MTSEQAHVVKHAKANPDMTLDALCSWAYRTLRLPSQPSTSAMSRAVYAPVQSTDRAAFFDSLPRDFPDDSVHVVMGDLNVPLDLYLDTERQHHDSKNVKPTALTALIAPSRSSQPQ
ncbi:hypothetical protein H310_11737 [Aphanomyces invadans]|uniref:Endonuclease/exonuclease/phosphatase domain-containing protein n=1 Tax=Aphanomyces invadans TaxID=157072 RepID=A0A024TMD4_9STRA|nr:hypothetical protein H310_11737 [Aphanomyces invadans]ETV94781.1 hypothetical protein H310_11737 [Aphanomyces invadans]|eukprot:XP_008876726.1 hypothetical protein H310_11737 [Aphanomyces invadans]